MPPSSKVEKTGTRDVVLAVDQLSVRIDSQDVVNDVSFSIQQGQCVGLVGESGSGKTMTALAIMGLLPLGASAAGSVQLEGNELLALKNSALRAVRGRRIAMVFQEPLAALNPVQTIGTQIAEMYRLHERCSTRIARRQAVDALAEVQIPDPERRARTYPHELSGGMRQRAMLAMALACRPSLLIADEPTTALDVTVQAQILDLVRRLARERDMAILFITHNLAVVSELADSVVVMYAGRTVELAPATALFDAPLHPYTAALLTTVPRIGHRRARLPSLPPSELHEHAATGCAFASRCPLAASACSQAVPGLEPQANDRHCACFHPLGDGTHGLDAAPAVLRPRQVDA